jgi:putative aminopeptidase FrvX
MFVDFKYQGADNAAKLGVEIGSPITLTGSSRVGQRLVTGKVWTIARA